MKNLTIGAAALAALVATTACERASGEVIRPAAVTATTSTVAGGSDAPVVVTCQPGQRAMVRPSMINGERISQVECIGAIGPVEAPATTAYGDVVPARQVVASAYAPAYAPQPQTVSYQPAPRPAVQRRVVYDDPDDRVVMAPRPVRQTVERRPAKRSVAKSALIIGSSAGIGAGVGGAIGGKKGALIGAAVGGGGATIWDQVTRRR
jgi:hypothetical protein